MFTVSVKAIYGLCAMAELGIKHNTGPVQIREIAEAHDIPQHYLEQLLVILKKAGLVESFRGAQGGYALARNPSQIQVPEILSVLDGKLNVVPEKKRENALNFFWQDLQTSIFKHMNITLEDLILKQQNEKGKFIYTI